MLDTDLKQKLLPTPVTSELRSDWQSNDSLNPWVLADSMNVIAPKYSTRAVWF